MYKLLDAVLRVWDARLLRLLENVLQKLRRLLPLFILAVYGKPGAEPSLRIFT
jgi:hypothetical protein